MRYIKGFLYRFNVGVQEFSNPIAMLGAPLDDRMSLKIKFWNDFLRSNFGR